MDGLLGCNLIFRESKDHRTSWYSWLILETALNQIRVVWMLVGFDHLCLVHWNTWPSLDNHSRGYQLWELLAVEDSGVIKTLPDRWALLGPAEGVFGFQTEFTVTLAPARLHLTVRLLLTEITGLRPGVFSTTESWSKWSLEHLRDRQVDSLRHNMWPRGSVHMCVCVCVCVKLS